MRAEGRQPAPEQDRSNAGQEDPVTPLVVKAESPERPREDPRNDEHHAEIHHAVPEHKQGSDRLTRLDESGVGHHSHRVEQPQRTGRWWPILIVTGN